MYDAVIFDLDGVLIDSRTAIARSINHALATHGLPEAEPESLYRFIGPPLERAFETLLTEHGDDPAHAPELVAAYRDRYRVKAAEETLVYDGIRELLSALAPSPMAVATLKPASLARPLMGELGLARHFTAIEGPALGDSHELKAGTAARALGALGGPDPSRTPLVGDRATDIAAARELGLPAIAVRWGIGDEAELAGADAYASTPAELRGLLQHLTGRRPSSS